MNRTAPAGPATAAHGGDIAGPALEVHDGRTGRDYHLAIADAAIRATDLHQIGADMPDAEPLMAYDPAFMNTAACRSAITYIDGDKGILRYRGYPIEQLAGAVPFLDVAWLLIHGELPSGAESRQWAADAEAGTELPSEITALVATFPEDAHPMAVLLAAWAALGAYRPESRAVEDADERIRETPRFLGAIAALVGLVFRHRTGRPLVVGSPRGDHAERLWRLMFAADTDAIDPALSEAIDVLLVLQADHEQNCSTNAVRAVGSSRVDPYSATAAGIAALYGPLHGGANEAVVRMLHEIESVDHVPAYVDAVKGGEHRLMGFGHRVYKSYDPRARIIKAPAERVFAVTGTKRLLDGALEGERIALQDAYFVERKLYPNVDFYSGLIYEAMGMPIDTYTTLFAAGRMAGWVAQWLEMIVDPEQKIARPRQIYTGKDARDLPGT
jgi:citrate synthase